MDERFVVNFPFEEACQDGPDAASRVMSWRERGLEAQAVGRPAWHGARQVTEWVCLVKGILHDDPTPPARD